MKSKLIEQHAVTEGFYYSLLLNFHESLEAMCKIISLQPAISFGFENLIKRLPDILSVRPDLSDMVFIVPILDTHDKERHLYGKWFVVKPLEGRFNAFKVATIEYGSLYPETRKGEYPRIAIPTIAMLIEIE